MPTKGRDQDAPGTEFYTTALTCGTCGGDLNKSGQWLRCRAHFTRRIAELEDQLKRERRLNDPHQER